MKTVIGKILAGLVFLHILTGFGPVYSLKFSVENISGDGWPKPLQQALQAIKAGDCATAWALAWQPARSGNPDAVKFLAETLRGGLYPPRENSPSMELWHRYWMTIFTYANMSDKEFPLSSNLSNYSFRQVTSRVIRNIRRDDQGKLVAACFDSVATPEFCRDFAVSLGVVSDFPAFIRDVERERLKTAIRNQFV